MPLLSMVVRDVMARGSKKLYIVCITLYTLIVFIFMWCIILRHVRWINMLSQLCLILSFRKINTRNINTCPQNALTFDVQRHQSAEVVPHEKLWRKATRILCKVKDDLPSPFGVFSRFCRSQLTSLWMYSSVLHQRLQRWQRKYEKQIFSGRGYKERNNMKICRMAVRQVPPDSEIESCRLFARPCLALIEPDNQP